jgi:hypothetical protein
MPRIKRPHLGEPRLEGSSVHSGGVIGTKLEPGAQTRLLVIGCIAGELDAEMSSAGKLTTGIGWSNTGQFDGPDRTAQDRLEAPGQLPAPVRPREDMHITAKGRS